LFGKFEQGSTLVLSRISWIASGLALLEDEQKFKLGECVGTHKTLISCVNMSSKCINNHVFTLSSNLVPQF
jgi:hypothetical protein